MEVNDQLLGPCIEAMKQKRLEANDPCITIVEASLAGWTHEPAAFHAHVCTDHISHVCGGREFMLDNNPEYNAYLKDPSRVKFFPKETVS